MLGLQNVARMTTHRLNRRDVWVQVGEQRAIVGPARRRRRFERAQRWPHPPTWLLLGKVPSDGGIAPTIGQGSFRVTASGELAEVLVEHGLLSPSIQSALLEAGRDQWRRR